MKPVKSVKIVSPHVFSDAGLYWRPLSRVRAPAAMSDWLADQGSLTRRLERFGQFRVQPVTQGVGQPTAAEAIMLGLPARRRALIREVLLLVENEPVVAARSVLPLTTLVGANRILGHMARRSLGTELFRRPRAIRLAVWAAMVPADRLPVKVGQACWGRQSLFLKRGRPLLVAEVFLPALQRLTA